MKKNLILLIFTISSLSYACPELDGVYKMTECSGNEPVTVLYIPKLGTIVKQNENTIKIENIDDLRCDYRIQVNNEQSTIISKDDNQWSNTYNDIYLKSKVGAKNIILKSKLESYGPFSTVNNETVKISKHSNILRVKRNVFHKWHIGYIPVIDIWNQKCSFIKAE